MKGTIRMSARECERMAIMGLVESGQMSVKAAALEMDVCYRQAKRIWWRWRNRRAWGLVHQGRGRISNNRLSETLRLEVLELYQARYGDFGPTLACEYLAQEHGIVLSRETLRRWLIDSCLWQAGRRRCRRQRPRRERFGELVQLDGSQHRWLEDRDDGSCLMVMIDDATNHTETYLDRGETLDAAFTILRIWIERHGIPQALYVDRRNVYVGNDGCKRTDFGRACRELGIRIITAHSPQAKGRVERRNALLQDRLLKHWRLAGANTIEQANALAEPCMARINERFRFTAACEIDAHRLAPAAEVLDAILCPEQQRTVDRDGTISIASRRWRIEPAPTPGSRVSLRLGRNGQPVVVHNQRRLQCLKGYR